MSSSYYLIRLRLIINIYILYQQMKTSQNQDIILKSQVPLKLIASYLTIILIMILLVQPTRAQMLPVSYSNETILNTQPLKNLVMEEGEQIEYKLSDYFQGSLLGYSVDFINFDVPFVVDMNLKDLIKVTKPFLNIGYQTISNQTLSSLLSGFQRSTIVIEENKLLHMYFIDRFYKFQMFEITFYSTGNLTKVYEYQLNTTLVNGTCSDLTHVQNISGNSYLVFFCLSYNYTDNMSSFTTVVRVEQYNTSDAIFRYYAQQDQNASCDIDVGLRFIRALEPQDHSTFSGVNVMFIGQKTAYSPFDQPGIFGVNFTMFDEMAENNETEKIDFEGTLSLQALISMERDLGSFPILDYITISSGDNTTLGLLLKNTGLIICGFQTKYLEPEEFIKWIPCMDPSRMQRIQISSPLSLYMNNDDSTHLLVTQSLPPGIVQINIENPQLAFIERLYSVRDTYKQFLGLKDISTNNNYIVQMMQDVATGQQVLRVYYRNGTFHNLARFDYQLPPYYKLSFVTFPNYFLNLIFIRDERLINVTYIDDNKLVLNGSNLTLFDQYLQQTVLVNLTVSNQLDSINVTMNVTFVNASDHSVRSIMSSDYVNNIFYSCGDVNFEYVVQDYYNGPYYILESLNQTTGQQSKDEEKEEPAQRDKLTRDLEDDDCVNGSCFFTFQNQDLYRNFYNASDFSNCKENYFYSYIQDKDSPVLQPRLILVCVDAVNTIVSSYLLCVQRGIVEKTNEIKIPGLVFQQIGYDSTRRMLFILSRLADEIVSDNRLEIHFFYIENHVQWVSMSKPFFYQNAQLNQVASFSYDYNHNTGVLVDQYSISLSQYIAYFEIDYDSMRLNVLIDDYFYIPQMGLTMKAVVANTWFIYAMQTTNRIGIYEAQPNQKSLRLMYQKQFSYTQFLIYDFDIFDDVYLVLYMDTNTIQVYELSMYIYLNYKMTLPLYDGFKAFKFYQQQSQNPIARSYANQIFSIIMYQSPTNDTGFTYFLFVFSFEGTQRNSFLMARNLTDVLANSNFQSITIKENQADTELALLTDSMAALYYSRFYNAIILNNDSSARKKLYDACSIIKQEDLSQREPAKLISKLQIRPVSLFNTTTAFLPPAKAQWQNTISIDIYSENQGLAITPARSQQVNLSYSNQESDSLTQSLLLESIIEGHNLNYSYTCTFFDDHGVVQSCLDGGITDKSQQIPYYFTIELVTSQRQIIKSVSMNKLFFMFDNNYTVNIFKLPQDPSNPQAGTNTSAINFDNINGFPLEFIDSGFEAELIGCLIDSFVKQFRLHENDDATPPYKTYLIMFQCRNDEGLFLKLALLKVYDYAASSKDLVEFKYFDSYQPISNNVIDVQKIQTYAQSESYHWFSLGITLEIEGSYTNVFRVVDIMINTEESFLQIIDQDELTAESLNYDTFLATNLLALESSQLVFIVTQNRGVSIYDCRDKQLIMNFDVLKDDPYQDSSQYGDPLYIFNVIGDWPNSFHVLTNRGIYIYYFATNLTDRASVFPFYYASLIPVAERVLRFRLDQLQQEIASNKFGYAFLLKILNPANTFSIYIGVVSFNSGKNSELFKLVKISDNQDCISLQHESYILDEGIVEDQLAISLVCNIQLVIVKITMKPYIIIDMQKFSTDATQLQISPDGSLKYEAGLQQFNQFNITVLADNEFTVYDINPAKVSLNVQFQYSANSVKCVWFLPVFVALGVTFLALAVTILIINNVQGAKRDQTSNESLRGNDKSATFDRPYRLSDATASIVTEATVPIVREIRERMSRTRSRHMQESIQRMTESSPENRDLILNEFCKEEIEKPTYEVVSERSSFMNFIRGEEYHVRATLRETGKFILVDENSRNLSQVISQAPVMFKPHSHDPEHH